MANGITKHEGSNQAGGNHNARTSPVTFDAVGRKPPKSNTATPKKSAKTPNKK